MPRSNQGPSGRSLTGGRALYTGVNAYASQGFENDTRQSQLPALAIIYLWGDQIIPAATDTAIKFNLGYASSTFNPIFTRGIYFNPTDFSLYCQMAGTYRFDMSARAKTLGGGTTAVMRVRTRRGINERQQTQALPNLAAGAGDFTLSLSGYLDLLPGDQVFITVSSSGGFTLGGGSTTIAALGGLEEDIQPTFLHLYQVDLT